MKAHKVRRQTGRDKGEHTDLNTQAGPTIALDGKKTKGECVRQNTDTRGTSIKIMSKITH